MLDKTKERILDVFKANNGYARTAHIESAGISRKYISQLVKEAAIEQIKRGLYKLTCTPMTSDESLTDVCNAIPKGVICLESAISYYNLSSLNPWQVSVAIENKQKVILPQYPPIRLYYFTEKMFDLGIEHVETDNGLIRIYSIEKTVCDCIRFRNKIGIDIVKEVITSYIKRTDKNTDLLMNYARLCRVEKILKTYLEVLI